MITFTPSLFRVPFIIINAITGQIATMPPNRAPENNEQKKYDESKHREPLTAVMSWYLPTFWLIMHALSLSELYVILATAYPVLRSPQLLSILLPSKPLITTMAHRLQITPLFIVGTAFCCTGALLRLACYRHLGRYFTFELALRKEHKLITDGPYGFVRHPSYLGSVLFFSGLLLCQFGTGSWWTEGGLWATTLGKVVGAWWLAYVAFLLVSMVIIRVPKEDKVLQQEFGKQWVEWSKNTPYRLFPGIY